MKIKYYYSTANQIREQRVIADANGNTIYAFPQSKFIKYIPRIIICTILTDNVLSFGFATCSHKDEFSIKTGRKIARNRAEQKPYKTIQIENIKDIHNISDSIINEIFESESKRIWRL